MSAQESGAPVRGGGRVLVLSVPELEIRRLEAKGGRGQFRQLLLYHSRIRTGKSGGGEGNSLFAVGMRGGAQWNVAMRNRATRGLFCANTVTLFLVWALWERSAGSDAEVLS